MYAPSFGMITGCTAKAVIGYRSLAATPPKRRSARTPPHRELGAVEVPAQQLLGAAAVALLARGEQLAVVAHRVVDVSATKSRTYRWDASQIWPRTRWIQALAARLEQRPVEVAM